MDPLATPDQRSLTPTRSNSPGQSLLSACGKGNVERGNPRRPFYARDLDRKVSDHARAVCTAAGMGGEALLDACTLDVSVIGNDRAAQVYVNAPEPTAVGNVGNHADQPGYLKWLIWLVSVVIVLWMLRLLLTRIKP